MINIYTKSPVEGPTNIRKNIMNKAGYTVNVLVNGKPVKEYLHEGNTYIEAKEGTKYSIKVKNHSYSRIKAVITVDGISILSDDKSDQDSGYIVNGHDSLHVKGFRTSENEENVFIFTKKGESRAQKAVGYAKNCGVIGVKIYQEYIKPKKFGPNWRDPIIWNDNTVYPLTIGSPFDDTYTTYDFQTYCCVTNTSTQKSFSHNTRSPISNNVVPASFSMGTDMGEEVESKISYVDFKTGNLKSTFEVFYLNRKEMKKIGIDFSTKKQVSMPQAFPKFCKKVNK